MINIFNYSGSDTDVRAIMKVLDQHGVPYVKNFIKELLKTHPNIGSLYSIGEVFRYFNFEVMGVKLIPEKLFEINLPAIVRVDAGRSPHFCVLSKVDRKSVSYYDPVNGNIDEDLIEFSRKWNGTVLLIFKTNKTGDINLLKNKTEDNKNKFKTFALMTMVLFVLISSILIKRVELENQLNDWLILYIINIFGLLMSCLLILRQVGFNTPVLEKICSKKGKFSCEGLINSNASQIFNWLSWSEVCLSYYVGSFLFLISIQQEHFPQAEVLLLIMSTLCLPFSVGLILYQIKRGEYCPLCLFTHVALWIQFAFLFFTIDAISVPYIIDFIKLITLMIIPLAFWISANKVIENGDKMLTLRRRLNIFLDSDLAMKALLDESESIDIWTIPNDISIGDNSSQIKIVAYMNPNCPECFRAYNDLILLLKICPVNVTLRFDCGEYSRSKKEFAQYVASYNILNGSESTMHLLNYWFSSKSRLDIRKLKDKFPLGDLNNDEAMKRTVETWYNWASANGVNATPTFIINGKLKPEGLNILEFKSFFLHTYRKPATEDYELNFN